MSSAILERAPHGAPAHTHLSFGAPAPASPAAGYCVVPRCTIKAEKCAGGMKLKCVCDDDVSCATLQNLCKMLCDGLCSCCCTLNGIAICQCNLACGICSCEYTKDGVCITCKSGDKACCDIIQACCACIEQCLESGCHCQVSFHSTPVCCGSC
jgi:hypothetical protein